MKKKCLILITLIVVASAIVMTCFFKHKSNKVTASNKNNIEQSNKVTASDKNNIEQPNKVTASDKNNIEQPNKVTASNKNNIEQPNKVIASNKQNIEQPNKVTASNKHNIKQPNKVIASNKLLTKKDAVSLILKNELLNQPLPKYFIPVKASQDNYNNLKKVNDSNGFLCNEDNKLDNGILVELLNFNENSQINYFTIKNYDAIKNGGKGLVDKGTISNTGEVKFFR
ncbi:hypothetical protein [Clostridium estertheticum]|uniref:hypothetical protein n=1 Tax=Clostridium estertheticum TaxID=238834 RepID=UPI001C7D9A66|nr:hypothetical protein [Clostridium estertheticum]MBX4268426.1 hypothetical protein [Clostridium estertheticum]WLC81514.1 hypothetical protein KTC98_10040 [Clostridium estertheticum]